MFVACNARAPHCHLCPTRLYNFFFSTLSHKWHDFRNKIEASEPKTYVLIFSTTFFLNISHLRRTERDMMKNVYWPSYKGPFILVTFYWIWNFPFSTDFRKILKNIELHGQTDKHDGGNSVCLHFSNAPEMGSRVSEVGIMPSQEVVRSGVRVPRGARDFSILHTVQTLSGAHAASYSMSTGVLSRG